MNADRAEGDEEVETSSAGAPGACNSGSQPAQSPIASLKETFPPDQRILYHRSPERGYKARLSWPAAIGLFAVFAFALPAVIHAADGELDPSFGDGGIVVDNFGSANDTGSAMAIQTDGKIVAMGSAFFNATGYDFAIARYNADGSPDLAFGSEGKVVTDFAILTGFDGSSDIARAVALQADGKIVVAGTAAFQNFGVARYNPGGSLDVTFGNGGRVITRIDELGDTQANALLIQTDGRIVAVGYGRNSNNHRFEVALVRYNSDGTLDPTFGVGGRVIANAAQIPDSDDRGIAAALQGDGKIVVAGSTAPPSGTQDFLLLRYNPDGTLDQFFGNAGITVTGFGQMSDQARAIALQSDGKIVVAGLTVDSNTAFTNFALARYNSSGTLDLSFAGDGKVTTDFAGDDNVANSVAIQPDGKIILAGTAHDTFGLDFALARYNAADGSLDPTFGSSGKLVLDYDGFDDSLAAIAVQSDGKILAFGNAGTDAGSDFALLRFLNGGGGGPTSADLALTASAQPGVVAPGASLTYTLTVVNNGPGDAVNVVVLDTLPSSLAFASGSATAGGTVSSSGNDIAITFASLAAAQTATITLNTAVSSSAPDGSTITNTADVGASASDPDNGNNTATTATTVATPHTVTFYLHGNDAPVTATGFTMNQTAPPTHAQTFNFAQSPSWFSEPALTGTFQSGATFKVRITRTLGLLIPATTYRLAATSLDGSGEQLLGMVTQSATLGTQTVAIPVPASLTLSNQRLKLTVTTGGNGNASVQLGANTYVQVTGFAGTP